MVLSLFHAPSRRRSPLMSTNCILRLASLAIVGAILSLSGAPFAHAAEPASYDVVVYGGTSGGVIAAVQAAKHGKSVVLIEPGKHLGGLTSGGLGATDIGNKGAIGGLSREFYKRIFKYYENPAVWKQESPRRPKDEDTMWTFEPHVAEKIYRQFIEEAKVPVVYGERLDLKAGVKKSGGRIESITMESGKTFAGKMFIDATYEGDVMAKAGVSYHVGREANATYKETLNGVQLGHKKHQFNVKVDPYIKPGDPTSGLLPAIFTDPGKHGEEDKKVQAYNFRMCLTDAADNKLPFPKPEGYDPLRYELGLRTILAGQWDGVGNPVGMPNRKTDTNNNGAFSTDNIGMNYDYPDGDYATRQKIFDEHVCYQQGLMWFWANDERVPERIRLQTNRWGLSKDEFPETGGWPHQMYVREARRMISDYVMTQHNCQGKVVAEDAVGLAAYTMDSHNTQRFVQDGRVLNEGDVQVGGFPPYSISYRSIVPKQSECENLLVPVCLSATHIAYGSIRMEPVFMVLGQSAATAASFAIDEKIAIQKVDVAKLTERLLADGQILTWKGGGGPGAGLDVKKLGGLVFDDAQATKTGEWSTSATVGPFVGAGYLHDNNEEKGKKSILYKLPVETAGKYEVRLYYTPNPNRATNVPVTIVHADGTANVTVNERQKPVGEGYVKLGTFRFTGDAATIEISNAKTDGFVVVDAVQLSVEK